MKWENPEYIYQTAILVVQKIIFFLKLKRVYCDRVRNQSNSGKSTYKENWTESE